MKVSIIIPYQHDRGYLDKAIESVEKQKYKNIELILSQSENSVGYNFNRGVERATGDYIKYLCDDDMLTVNSVQDSVKAMQDNDFIHGNAINLFSNGQHSVHRPSVIKPTLPLMLIENRIHGGTLMYRANVFERFGMMDETLFTGEEYDMNLMFLSKGAKIGYCDSWLYYYRRHEQQKSLGNLATEYQNKRRKQIQEIRKRYENSNWNSNVQRT
jgi:glycosyltransferase involved in cell wall biosynthesis